LSLQKKKFTHLFLTFNPRIINARNSSYGDGIYFRPFLLGLDHAMEPVTGTRDMTSTGHTTPGNVKFRDKTEISS